MPKISIIVPVYNCYLYLPQCVDSVFSQSFEDFELILVNDGSTDGRTSDLLSEIEASDSRVRVITQQNGGTSAARNTGLRNANGEFVTFLDNDDWWTSDGALWEIVQVIDNYNPDVIMHMSKTYRQDKDCFVDYNVPLLARDVNGQPRTQALKTIISGGGMQRAVWAKVVRRTLIETNDLCFPEGKRNEDTEWSAALLVYAKSYGWVDDVFYAYRKGAGVAQTSKPITPDLVDGLGEIVVRYSSVYEHISENDPQYGNVCLAYLAYPLMVWMGQSAYLGILHKGTLYNQLKMSARRIIGTDLDPQTRLASMSYRLLGFNLTCKLLGLAYGITSHRGY